MSSCSFKQPVDALQKPTAKSSEFEPVWPYPLPEAEMIRRYGLRPLTPAEQVIFPGLALTRHIDKVRLIKPPAGVPKGRAGWVVWLAESYPGTYLLRLPGGATQPIFHNQEVWEKVSLETAVTTVDDLRAEEKRRLAEAQKWRPGQMITTRGTRLSFNLLSGWIGGWQQLQERSHSSDRYQKEAWHIQALPPEMIMAETDETVLYDFLSLLKEDDALPARGLRPNHAATPLVVVAHNRLAQLGATPYRQHVQQKRLRQVLARQTEKRPLADSMPAHLSLF